MFAEVFITGLVLSFILLVPLGTKWDLEKKITVPAAFIIGILSGAIVMMVSRDITFFRILALQTLVIGVTSASLLLWRFYRDPERDCPEDENAILSPADGKVIYIRKVEDGKVPYSEKNGKIFPLSDFTKSDLLPQAGYLVGISMNFLDVHVNRAPMGGKICLLNHIKGLFVSLKMKEAIIQNERVLTVIDNGRFKVGIIQIASRLVRKIVSYFQEGSEVKKGQRTGAIRFGSQVDIYLPELPSLSIKVSPGDKVKAGISIVATV